MSDEWEKQQLEAALEFVRKAGFQVKATKPHKPRGAAARPEHDCLGFPLPPFYEHNNWKRRTRLTSIARLSAPQNFPMTK